jgi:hypothetical protein
LAIAGEELDLGRVWETKSLDHLVHMRNTADRSVTISRFEKSCSCLEIAPDAGVTLQPGEAVAVNLTLALTPRFGRTEMTDGEPFVVRFAAVYAVDGRAEETAEWQVKVVTVPTLRLRPPVVQFGTRSERQPPLELRARIEANKGVESIQAVDPSGGAVEILPESTERSPAAFTVVLRDKTKRVPGRVSDVIRLTPVDGQGNRLPEKELKIVGEVVHDVVAQPREIHHGRQTCGTRAEETIRLTSLGGTPFRVVGVMSSSPDLQAVPLSEDEGGRLYSLRMRFERAEDQEARAEFTIREEDGNEFGITVPVRYHGVQGP